MGKASDWIKNEVDKRLKALISKNPQLNPTAPGPIEFITFTNPLKDKGRTNGGFIVDTIPQGSIGKDGWGIRISPNKYLVTREKARPKNIDGSDEGLLLHDTDTANLYYLRKMKSRTFYSFTPPTVNTYQTSPAPATYWPFTGTKNGSNMFLSRNLWFCYNSRLGGPSFSANPDLLAGEIQINYAFVTPSFTVNNNSYTVTYTTDSGTYKVTKSSIAGCPAPGNTNTFVFSSGYTEEITSPDSNAMYDNITITYTEEYEVDVDAGSSEIYTNTYQDYRDGGAIPQNPGTNIEGGCVLCYKEEDNNYYTDLFTSYLQANYPFSGKRLKTVTTTWEGTYTTIFIEEYGNDPEELITSQTPMTGNWAMQKTIEYTYGATDPETGFRSRTSTTTYSVTVADLIEYTPLGTLFTYDSIISGGPLGTFDLKTGTPPFGYISCFAHGPTYFETIGSQVDTPIFNLTDPGDPAFVVTLAIVETTEASYLGDLPFENTVVDVDSVPGYYSTLVELLPYGRSQYKLLTVSKFNQSPSLQAETYYDFEFWHTESTESDSESSSDVFGYDNTEWGGYDSYSCSLNVDNTYDGTSITTDPQVQVNLNHFSYLDFFLDVPFAINAYTFSGEKRVIIASGSKLASSTYGLTSNQLEDDEGSGGIYKFHPVTTSLDQVVDQVATFGLETEPQGSFSLTDSTDKITVWSYSPLFPTPYGSGTLKFWTFNGSTWDSGKAVNETFSEENPLTFPSEILNGIFSVSQFRY